MSLWRSPHDAQTAHQGKKNALGGAIALSLSAFGLQIAGAWHTGSLALIGDSAHLFTDLLSLVMALGAVVLAARPTSEGRSFGLYRLEVLASFVNGLLLLVVALTLAVEALQRLWAPEPVKSLALLVVASVGLLFNLASAGLLLRASRRDHTIDLHQHHHHGHDHGSVRTESHGNCDGHHHGPHDSHHHEDRNLRSALLHVWSDALGSLAVIAGAVVIHFTGYFWVDAAVGLALALWILRWAFRVIVDSGHVLLESTPKHVRPESLVSELRALDARVRGVEDLHVWELTSRMYAATAEVRVQDMSLEQAEALRLKMHALMRDKFGIAHVVLAIRPQ